MTRLLLLVTVALAVASATGLSDQWQPKVVAEMNDYQFKVV